MLLAVRLLTPRKAVSLCALLMVSLSVFACGGVPWKVVKESGPPSALLGAADVGIYFDYTPLYVEGFTEAEWVAKKTAEDQAYGQTWEDLKARFESAYVAAFMEAWGGGRRVAVDTAPKPGGVVVQVRVDTLEIGHYIPFAQSNSQVSAHLVWHAQGPEDEIVVQASDRPSLTNPSIFQHIAHMGARIGRLGATFLKSKQQ